MGRNLFKFVKTLMTSLSFQCYDVKGLCCFFVFLWIKLKFGVGGNFGPLISNLRSKT